LSVDPGARGYTVYKLARRWIMTSLQQMGKARLLDDLRAEVKPTAESMVWRFSEAGDEMFLDIEWTSGGEVRFDTYLSSNVNMRYVYLVESSADEEMTA
jgi:hypothetical protein